ncbi:hypothetical protein [Neobacillus drentensis]|jgi:hypothetical protein|uniref:hypothetical protein n=1 Tax=Neobacillus drentensis TaxID=220684 RepID=UPI002FFD899A
MNHEHLMKFTLRQMELERNSKLKAKRTLFKKIPQYFKVIMKLNKLKITGNDVKDND